MPERVKRLLATVLVLGVALTGCTGRSESRSVPPELHSGTDLERLLLTKEEIDVVMGTRSMTPQELSTELQDNGNLLSNLNCLGVWQVGEAKIYGSGGWSATRRQRVRTPDVDDWDDLAVQSVVAYPSVPDARNFFAQSSDRWAKCTNHHVNITLNDRALPRWFSGDLRTTDTRLAMQIARGSGAATKQCQHVLEVVSNLILDVETCKSRQEGATEAGEIVDEMKSKLAN